LLVQDGSTDYADAVEEQERRVLAADLLLHLADDPGATEEGTTVALAAGMTTAAAFIQLGWGPGSRPFGFRTTR